MFQPHGAGEVLLKGESPVLSSVDSDALLAALQEYVRQAREEHKQQVWLLQRVQVRRHVEGAGT